MNKMALLLTLCLGALGGCTMLGKIGKVMMDPSITVGGPDQQPSQFSLSLYASATLNINPDSALMDGLPMIEAQPVPLSVNLSAQDPLELTHKLQAVLQELQHDYPAMSPVEPDQPIAMSPATPWLADYGDPQIRLGLATAPKEPSLDALSTPITFQVLQLKDDSLLLDATHELLAKDPKKALGTTLVRIDDYRLMPGHFKFVDFETIEQDTRYLAVIAHYHAPEEVEWKHALRIEPQGHRHAVLMHFGDKGVALKRERQ